MIWNEWLQMLLVRLVGALQTTVGLVNNCAVPFVCWPDRVHFDHSFPVLSPLSAVWSICVAVLAPKLPSCNPPSMTQPTWCVSAVEWLPALAPACGMKLLLAPVVCGHKGHTQQSHKNSSVTGCWWDFTSNCVQERCSSNQDRGGFLFLASLD